QYGQAGGVRDGDVLCSCRGPDVWRLRLRARIPRGEAVSRCQDHRNLRGHERGPATRNLPPFAALVTCPLSVVDSAARLRFALVRLQGEGDFTQGEVSFLR